VKAARKNVVNFSQTNRGRPRLMQKISQSSINKNPYYNNYSMKQKRGFISQPTDGNQS